MKVGLFINAQFPEGFNLAERVPEMIEQVRAAHDAGFASLWFPHHWLTHPMQMLQLTPLMGYVAAHARGMTIGPNILILPPFNEAIGLIRRLWTEDRVNQQGRFYTVNDAGISLKPVRAGGPPIYIAAQAEVPVKRAARIGDAWLIVNIRGIGNLVPLMQTYRTALTEYGRTPIEYPITVECYVGERHATAHEECREPLEFKYSAYAAWGMEDRTSSSFEDFARDRFIIGDKVSVREEIARYRELLGVDHFIMRCQWPGLPQGQVLSSIQRLGEIFAS